MSVLRRFLQLSMAERLLLGRALLALLFVRLWLPFASLERLEQWARPAKARPQPLASIVWAVRSCARRLPGTTCLAAALVLQRLLAAGGHESELHIGVAQEAGGLGAHAWVVRDGEVLIGGQTQAAYASLMHWK
ncbi:MAG: lasso peptide biosynthesis B2 protein [Alphaproteobacteria bacterium]|nr:MAG: lasso peptide biosynthesis B2 protein [Alphaproteobacteria bacterium]